MKDLGKAKKILGMEIIRDRSVKTLLLTQEKYVKRVVHRFGMVESKSVQTPLATHFRLSSAHSPKSEDKEQMMAKIPYAHAVGSLMYAMVYSRPDLAQPVSVVSRFMGNPGKEHWQAVKWILRYLNGTLNHGLWYEKSNQNSRDVMGFVDSDYAGDLDKRRSLTGYEIQLCGCTIS
ncbi:Retrovirus-related Pol polyprotein from transposon TNT 1-94 [Melia azedarach]|uniref:Retrovirus-related Pol polyprotein from transposon TNT 1-94 n=1 Tax=Melia azedarach TaxID=155640 RepID=A0ACC1YAW3_MELAZ|nr:Retrovirus-related Pol polyprotein from transposon TNT 1-94 [Melia azedarach]